MGENVSSRAAVNFTVTFLDLTAFQEMPDLFGRLRVIDVSLYQGGTRARDLGGGGQLLPLQLKAFADS